ncbi:hypothetical protein GCM10012275_44180 [Longimycelium tulufanense]|uniref:Uncharacterized protein n=1 Tax=Longimycelium tulufanense TaxID=907463 RepID=A0A8J3FWS3_9PSEU|nr:hypothetical protein [Longimycelium tulufanense]GGM68865.1 hypothetical protein GCM10012275_44180 [Longimycelium tulufanense]
MFKKISGVIVATATALAMVAGPAAAGGGYVHEEDNDFNGAVNVVSGNQVQIPVGVCQNNIGLIGLVIAGGSPMIMKKCATAKAYQKF